MTTNSKLTLLFGAALLATVSASQAGEIQGTVGTLVDTVSLSVSDTTSGTESKPVATYTVILKNVGTSNAIDNGRFAATAIVKNPLASDVKAAYKAANGATCTVENRSEGTWVDCSVGALAVNEEKSFTLSFYAPTSGTSIDLVWKSVFNSGSPPGEGNGNSDTTSITLEAINTGEVKTAIPASDDITIEIFTGYLAIPSESDPFTVSVTVPPIGALKENTTGGVTEKSIPYTDDPTCKAQGNFKNCQQATISVKGVVFQLSDDKKIVYALNVEKSNFRGALRLDKVLFTYEEFNATTGGLTYSESPVNFCNGYPDNPTVDSDGTPCLAKVNDYTKGKSKQGWSGAQFIFYALKNGRISVY